MKKRNSMLFAALLPLVFCLGFSARAQSTEVQQLLLNVEKLSQLKNILADMKKGYTIVMGGYNTIKNISQGNFSLHEFFLDGLMLVSSEVKKYRRVVDIIDYQKALVKEYKRAYQRFQRSGNFGVGELEYLGRVYKQLFDQSIDNLDELAMVITSSKLRMNDQERLQAIDRIFASTQDKLMFLRYFNERGLILNQQRDKQRLEIESVRDFYGLD
ncbi:MAG: TerB family tellurite resistance protein [Candidatus Pedobacter colombiensis]|uniref:TerB family tellurite resistance protein n=1 Tax=Candidatus Pedobacter colombiensis TaxID=3121371 RepID=A0AAJ6B812_9SPHI|nr:TerB family tellurite resistance protein [Pedobacter sp.]WEK20434.1 MAG: TerB family tellurite resistance protein [Pedobacter sp.]